jgi:hypothetical protein
MLQSMHMRKRIYLGGIAALFIVAAVGVFFGQLVFADDVSPASDEDALYTLRYHKSGSILNTTLAIYTKDENKPTNTRQFTIQKSGSGCKPSSRSKDIAITINIRGNGSDNVYNGGKLNSGNCKNDDNSTPNSGVYRTYNIPSSMWVHDDSTNRWYVELTLTLSGGNSDSSVYDTFDKYALFHYRAVANGNLIMTNRANDRNTPGSENNYGVFNANYYNLEFAQPCSSGPQSVLAGMWDPDSFDPNRIKIQERPRAGGGGWTSTPIAATAGIASGPDSDGWFEVKDGNEREARLQFTMYPDKKYRIRLNTTPANVVSLFWPYGTIQSQVDCKYKLTPTTTLNPNQSLNPGASTTITSTVTNDNTVAKPRADWYVTKLVYNDGDRARAGGVDSPSGPSCSYFGAVECEILQGPAQGASNYPFTQSSDSRSFSYRATNNDIGKRICFVTSVSPQVDEPRRNAGNVWRHSNIECVLVSKTPKVQVLGSDLRVLGSIGASTSVRIGDELKSYGSWIEYGAFSTGPNSLAGSGSSFRDGTTSDENSWSQLTFSNTTSPKGNYGVGSLPAATTASDFDNLESTGNLGAGVDISATPSGVYNAGNLSINGNIANSGRSIIIRSSGTVTINGNITVDDGIKYTSPDDISQVVILANNIVINGTVSRVDAWLLTRNGGLVNTCSDVGTTGPLVVSSCPTLLQVNGAVITDKLYLRRTGGADADTHPIAAEVFNLRASSYMWAYNFVNKQDRAQTTYVKELPPRF